MAAIPCKKCGKLRKIDIIIASDGWHQPKCYNCGDPEYIEPVTKKIVSDPNHIWPFVPYGYSIYGPNQKPLGEK